uniref:ZP domain-containing protein n=1 Tax=Cyprinus carpio TaxID=7962 RepID=A0A8C1YPE9_CYPCA
MYSNTVMKLFVSFCELSQNCEIKTRNSDFFSCNCEFISHNYGFFSCNYDFFSQNCEFKSRNCDFFLTQLQVIKSDFKDEKIFSELHVYISQLQEKKSELLLFQCRYSGTSVQALVVEVNTIPPPPPVAAPGPLRVELRLANGQCVTKGCAEGDEAYTSYYSDADYPITKVLREPVYVEVRIMERTDPNVVLMLGRCWATSTPSPLSLPQWDLLVDGCPYQDDHYLTTLVPVTGSSGLQFPTHYKRFVVKMFTFVDPASLAPLQETIFIHCSTAVCHPSSGSCEQSCGRTRRDTHVKTISSEQTVVSSGEVTLIM